MALYRDGSIIRSTMNIEHRSGAAGPGGVGAAPLDAPVRPKKVPIKHVVDEAYDMSVASLKRLLPQTKGCTVTLDLLWHNRVVVAYPRATAPFTKSCVFGPESKDKHTVASAFKVCAKWVWEAHYERTGEEAPYEFE